MSGLCLYVFQRTLCSKINMSSIAGGGGVFVVRRANKTD